MPIKRVHQQIIHVQSVENVIFSEAECRGKCDVGGLINPCILLLEVNNCFVIMIKTDYYVELPCYKKNKREHLIEELRICMRGSRVRTFGPDLYKFLENHNNRLP